MTFSTPSGARSEAPIIGASFVSISHASSFGSRVTAWPSRLARTDFPAAVFTWAEPTKKQWSVSPSTTSVGSMTRPIAFHGSFPASDRNPFGSDHAFRSGDSL
jgi:hypothetical protein